MSDTLTWTEIAALEPTLLELEQDIRDGRQTMTTLMLSWTDGLTPLVGRFAIHPRLRNSECYGLAYDHLAAVDRRWREARALAAGIGQEVTP